ncbi:MAG: nucleoside hydrolase [Planctomycetaceae bacterium]|nr:nucleoside hydrolase [Planctomycetaceae bacterium]
MPTRLSRAAVLFFIAVLAVSSGNLSAEPVRLIFDTDMGNDVDDALALGVIHALQSRGECELLAVTATKDNDMCAPYLDAVNTFYGRGDIPIGVVKGGMTPEPGKFLPLTRQSDDGRLRYPHDLASGKDAPEATSLLRAILSKQPDNSVVLAQVGFSTNFVRLLASESDQHSKLAGRELIARKVKVLSIMAGAFRTIRGNKHYLEYNVVKDIPSAKIIAKDWPTPIVYSGFEIGIAIPYPATSIERDFGYVKHHPLAESYRLYNPPPHNRPTWDLTSVLYGVYPDRGFFNLSDPGQVTVEDDGFTRFAADLNGKHRYLIATPEQIIRVKEALVQLSSQPPQASGGR